MALNPTLKRNLCDTRESPRAQRGKFSAHFGKLDSYKPKNQKEFTFVAEKNHHISFSNLNGCLSKNEKNKN